MEPTETSYEKAQRFIEALKSGLRLAMKPRSVKHYAGELGLDHKTLLNKTDPDNCSDTLTLEQAARLLVSVPDHGLAMRPAASVLGGQYFSLNLKGNVPDNIHRSFTQIGIEMGEFGQALVDGADPDSPGGTSYTTEELNKVDAEADDLYSAIKAAVAAAREHAAQCAEEETNVAQLRRKGA